MFSYLLKEIKPNLLLYAPAQIGIEVAVPQVSDFTDGARHKAVVRKDLVIWHKPEITCWDGNKQIANYPLAIIEWKLHGFRKPRKGQFKNSSVDLLWLQKFSKDREDFIGYAVSIDITDQKYKMVVTKVTRGNKEAEWLLDERR